MDLKSPKFRRWNCLVTWVLGALIGCSSAGLSRAEEPAEGGSPFFQEVVHEFKTMTATRYQHKTAVDPAKGVYCYDCVGFVSYALRHSAPQAWASAVAGCGIRKGYFPSPPAYQKFFAGLVEAPQPGWQSVSKVSELRPGDVISWDHKTATAVGHAVVVAGKPSNQGDGVWIVEVYDSTGSPHQEDSRAGDARAQPLEDGGARSGLGHGVIALVADETSGALTGYRWSPKAKTIVAPIAAARPTS
ncbi:MAG: hypothetical protein QM755_25020 [Luteolibacter sp.]